MTRYIQRYHGEWFSCSKRLRLACCDCGLVHDMDMRVKKGRFEIRLMRNERASAIMRRKHRSR